MTRWVTKKLGDDDLFDFVKGEQVNGELLSVQGQYPMFNGGVDPSGYLDKYNTSAYQIIMSEGGNSCGYVNFITENFWRGGHCYLVKFKNEISIDKIFFYYLLKFHEENIMKLRVGSGLPNIQKKDLFKYVVSYPESIDEQCYIASILSSVDKAIASSEALIEKYRQIKQGLLTDLLTPKEGWGKVKLGEYSRINRGGSPRPIDAYVTERDDGINWIKIGDIASNGKYVNKTREKIITEGKRYSREVHKGDFILSNSMSWGRPYILNIDGCIHDGWLTIQDYAETFDTDFLYYMISSDNVKRQYLAMASGSTVLNLNKEKVAKVILTIPYASNGTPDLMEQRRIAAILSGIDTKIAIEQAVIAKYQSLKKGLMVKLMNKVTK